METQIRILQPGDLHLFDRVAPEVFDNPVDADLAAEFLDDPRHHLAVGIHDGCIVGMVSAVHYIHPDKPPQLWINEVGVSPEFRNRGIANYLLQAMFEVGRTKNCTEAWVLTDRGNPIAMRLYSSASGTLPPEDQVMFEFSLDR